MQVREKPRLSRLYWKKRGQLTQLVALARALQFVIFQIKKNTSSTHSMRVYVILKLAEPLLIF